MTTVANLVIPWTWTWVLTCEVIVLLHALQLTSAFQVRRISADPSGNQATLLYATVATLPTYSI